MKWRYEIENALDTFNITPKSGKDFGLTYTKADDRKFDYEVEISELVLTGEDYKYFENIEMSSARCELQTLRIYLQCGTDEVLKYEGIFAMSDGSWDKDKCRVSFKVKTADVYTCIEENDEDVNLLNAGLTKHQVELGVTIGIDLFQCINGGGLSCDESYIENGLYIFFREFSLAGGKSIGKWYIRWYMICPCNYIPGEGWVEFYPCTNGEKRYIKKITTTISDEIVNASMDNAYEDNGYTIADLITPITSIDNGFKLKDALEALMQEACVGLNLVSNFFQWNPEIQSNINYVTSLPSKINNIIAFQKSDVKRPNALNNATQADSNLNDMLDAVCRMFNCGYRIQNNVLRIEHISYFNNDLGLDLLNMNLKTLAGTRKYNYDDTKLQKYERFEFMEANGLDFIGRPIIYDSPCVGNDKENQTTNTLDFITTDVIYCLENPSGDSEKVSDDGFVFIACDSQNKIIKDKNILNTGESLNSPLSWAHLQNDYWRHGRVLLQGEMNNQTTTFSSIMPTINQEPFNVVLGCNALKTFDPLDKIRGALGWGVVQSAELKLHQCVVTFELALDSLQDTSGGGNTEYGDFDENFDENFD